MWLVGSVLDISMLDDTGSCSSCYKFCPILRAVGSFSQGKDIRFVFKKDQTGCK